MQQSPLLCLILCLFSFFINAQTPITLLQNNFPVYGTFVQRYKNAPPQIPNIVPSINGNWDYSSIADGVVDSFPYYPEFDPFFLNQGVDVYTFGFKFLTSTLGYPLYYEVDFNNEGVFEKGVYVPQQTTSLVQFTGNPTDSLNIPEQGFFFQGARQIMKFPATHQTAWTSKSRRVVNLDLTVGAVGLNKTPGQHVFTLYRTDTIVSYGRARVQTSTGSSIPYDVLVVKQTGYAQDSFYLGGQPAPQALLTVFGINQGAISGVNNRYLLYRAGNSTPFIIFNYGTNNFTLPSGIIFDTKNLSPTTDSEQPENQPFTTFLFPNPVQDGQFNLQFLDAPANLSAYTITDAVGRVVKQGNLTDHNSFLTIHCQGQLSKGQYWIHLLNDDKKIIGTETFTVLDNQ